ncbi:hypothetical protein HPB50_017167 [Hyalomma asiaticum]|uniref:Uncharacterized protein n=1 Tax=Hyalomma asiaticum TaxID=266040 RepID=A0ACB7SFI9_HYAAI|nr:hypothetical protein HPB50_017167 [Hyalomma asiaticum]
MTNSSWASWPWVTSALPPKPFFEAFSGEEKLPGGASNGMEEPSSPQASQLADWAERVPDFKPPVLDQDSPVEQQPDEIQVAQAVVRLEPGLYFEV